MRCVVAEKTGDAVKQKKVNAMKIFFRKKKWD
jgi:hypothetical protein